MGIRETTQIDEDFLALSYSERKAIISHGTALRLSDLRNRLFLAENKVRQYEQKYQTTLSRLEDHGLPDDAGYEMHEDYIMWRHWAETIKETKQAIEALEKIAVHGLYLGDPVHAGQ